jgi:hypothetical protein
MRRLPLGLFPHLRNQSRSVQSSSYLDAVSRSSRATDGVEAGIGSLIRSHPIRRRTRQEAHSARARVHPTMASKAHAQPGAFHKSASRAGNAHRPRSKLAREHYAPPHLDGWNAPSRIAISHTQPSTFRASCLAHPHGVKHETATSDMHDRLLKFFL